MEPTHIWFSTYNYIEILGSKLGQIQIALKVQKPIQA